jgi:hypothetical protein
MAYNIGWYQSAAAGSAARLMLSMKMKEMRQ